MTASRLCPQNQTDLFCCDLIQLIRNGRIIRLIRFIVEPFDDGNSWGIQTVAIARPDSDDGDRFPIVIVNLHEDDEAAMSFALQIFEELKLAGRASSADVSHWRRTLFTVVPCN